MRPITYAELKAMARTTIAALSRIERIRDALHKAEHVQRDDGVEVDYIPDMPPKLCWNDLDSARHIANKVIDGAPLAEKNS